MRTAVLTTSAAVATAAVVSTVALVTTSSGGDHSPARPGPTATTSRPPLPATTGIAATALAHGRWTNIAPAPIKLCGQTSVAWTGSVIVVVSLNHAVNCASAAAAYDPRRDRWHRLDAPPPGIGGQIVFVPAAGRVVAVSQLTGSAAAVDPVSGRWTALPSLPVRPVDPTTAPVASGIAAGDDVLVVGVGHDSDQAFSLGAGQKSWTELPRLPHPRDYHVVATAGYDDGVSTWVTMTTEKRHFNNQTQVLSVQGAASLLELGDGRWVEHPHAMQLMMTVSAQALGQGALVVGGGCLPGMSCPYSPPTILLANLRDGTAQQLPVSPLGGTTQGAFSTGRAVLVYDATGQQTGPDGDIRPGATAVYDVQAQRWLRAPHSVRVEQNAGEVWTPYGFVVLGQPMEKCLCNPGGLILRPARR
jgi:hypothetical protein